jgi:hypothetical protein
MAEVPVKTTEGDAEMSPESGWDVDHAPGFAATRSKKSLWALKSLNRSLKSEFIRVHTSIAAVRLDQLPGRPVDRGVPLSLPELDVERAIHLFDATEPHHHEIRSFGGCGSLDGLRAVSSLSTG